MVLAPAYDQKLHLRLLVLKVDVTLEQTLRLINLDFFFFFFFLPAVPSQVIGACSLMQNTDIESLI